MLNKQVHINVRSWLDHGEADVTLRDYDDNHGGIRNNIDTGNLPQKVVPRVPWTYTEAPFQCSSRAR